MKKNQQLAKSKKGPLLDLHNEVKIITSTDETYNLWSELIASYAQGELINVDTNPLRKFKESAKWKPEKDGMLSREFFKWLGNLTEADHVRMIQHILNRSGPKRTFKWPKVVIKQPVTVLDSCYTVGEWIERRKRKHLVRKELQKLRPQLAFFDAQNKYVPANWKRFKREYNVSSASLRLLLDQPGDWFFGEAKQMKSRNKKTEEISPYAKAFFKLFLVKRKKFIAPTGAVCFRQYNSATNQLGGWLPTSWNTNEPVKIAIVDFRNTPIQSKKKTSSVADPYFGDFMRTFEQKGMPGPSEPAVWLWISGDKETELQAYAHSDTLAFKEHYAKFESVYMPGKYERLEDAGIKSTKPVALLWLVKKPTPVGLVIPEMFESPDHPGNQKNRKYQELEYRVHNTELTMEFYLRVLSAWCQTGDKVVSVYAGSKILNAALVSHGSSPYSARVELNMEPFSFSTDVHSPSI
ncbi:hypothetical protein AVDCRST_MAG81-5244 [uncultured Synechococcales cyanobacterium]|uniref:Uncharacterized protein n=1 Tax=uncultured Synechococcales cyanobacterium TaxID=1936017 RepID=A0A6J4VVN1_9CYAN|nr:hypothetical protein AVDCRST_MAG81-5244 [uncultured Synechococcales cyanobacterium]